MSSQIKRTIDRLKTELGRGHGGPLSAIKDAFHGKTALVVSCGPSLKRWREVLAAEQSDDLVVVCIKQSILELGTLCDIHFTNESNHRKYDYGAAKPLIIHSKGESGFKFGKPHLVYDMISHAADLRNSLAAKRNYGDYTLDATGMHRPWGPGIMHESVFYTLLHMGFSRVVTIGWDIADSSGTSRHFDDQGDNSAFYERTLAAPDLSRSSASLFSAAIAPVKRLKRKLRHLKWWVDYQRGQKINLAWMLQGEAEVTSDSVPSLKAWLASKGLQVDVRSDSRWQAR